MAAYLPLYFDTQFLTDAAAVAGTYLLYSYTAGTTTPKATYTDSTGGVANANPMTLNSAARQNLWLATGGYSFELKTPAGALVKRWDNVTTGQDITTAVFSDLANSTTPTKGAGLIGYGPAVLYGTGTLGALMGKKVLVNLYGADTTASAATNDAAFLAAKAVLAASGFGGQIIYGRGQYLHSATLVLDVDDVEIVGAGGAANHNTITLDNAEGSTQLIFGNISGAGVHLKGRGCGLKDIVISSDATRYAQTWAVTRPGLLVEAADTADGASWRTKIVNTHVMWQPGDGIVLIGDLVQTIVSCTDVDNVKGHGLVIDDGTYTGRTNVQRPGQIELSQLRLSRTGGQALRIGDPTQGSNGRPYRVGLYMVESFNNRTDSATFTDAYTWWIGGDNIRSELGATGGETSAGVGDHAGIYTWGTNVVFDNHRFIDCELYCAYVDDPAGAGSTTRNVRFLDPYINNDNHGAGYYNPAIYVDPGSLNVGVRYHGANSDVTTLITDYGQHEIEDGSHKIFQGSYIATFKSNRDVVSISDDTAIKIGFPQAARGILMIAASVEGGNVMMVAFRCGDGSAYINIPVNSGTGTVTDGGVGVLTGTTGTDGHVTLKVDNSLNKLYLENRSGGTLSYFFTLLSSNTDISSIEVV